jgi:hypothetical protein
MLSLSVCWVSGNILLEYCSVVQSGPEDNVGANSQDTLIAPVHPLVKGVCDTVVKEQEQVLHAEF